MLELIEYGSMPSNENGNNEDSRTAKRTPWWGLPIPIVIGGVLLLVGVMTVWTQRMKNNSVGRSLKFSAAQPGFESSVLLFLPRTADGRTGVHCYGTMIAKDLILTRKESVARWNPEFPVSINKNTKKIPAVIVKSSDLVVVIRLADKNYLTSLGVKIAPPIVKDGAKIPYGKQVNVYGYGLETVKKMTATVGVLELSRTAGKYANTRYPPRGGPVFYTTGGKKYLFGVLKSYSPTQIFVVYLGAPATKNVVRALASPPCPNEILPVCGSDGKTYNNECAAKGASVAVSCRGECPCVSAIYNCPPGTYEISRSASGCVCEKCPAGHSCAGGTKSKPKGCAPGFYQPLAGQKDCVAASPGNKAPGEKSTKQTSCAAGEYQTKSGQTTCHKCPTGHKCPSPGTTSPSKCRAGYFQPNVGQTGCKAATRGNHVPTSGSPNEKPCDAGMYTDLGGQVKCKDCPIGHECPGKGNDKPIACPIGSYQKNAKSQACDACPLGHECPHKGMSKASECAVNTYQHCTGQPHCIPCAAGKVQPKKGQQSCVVQGAV